MIADKPLSQPQQQAGEVNSRLLDFYGEPPPDRKHDDPLAELIETILSQNTSDLNSGRAYTCLRQRLGDWESIARAPVEEIADAIRAGGLAQVKAPRIKQVLERIQQDFGSITLAPLRDMPADAARDYLVSLPGIGVKTAACVLLFSLDKPAIPVDTHVHRVSRRLGLVPPKASPEQTEAILERLVPPEDYYRLHMNLIRHGRQICKAPRPLCARCPLDEICPRVGVKG